MRSLKTVLSKHKLVESVLFIFVAFTVLLATYLFASYSRFLQGETIGTEFIRGGPNPFETSTPTYAFISEYYFNILIAMFIVTFLCWFRSNIVTSLFNLVLISYSIYQAWQIHQLKSDIYIFENYDFRYFDVVRETIIFDNTGAFLLIGSLILQIYLVWLISKDWTLRTS